jgi:hypothetical protein
MSLHADHILFLPTQSPPRTFNYPNNNRRNTRNALPASMRAESEKLVQQMFNTKQTYKKPR